ncbi:MAG TPA: OsmC family protein [Myxococcota bacterium]
MSNTDRFAVATSWQRLDTDSPESFHRGHTVRFGSGTTIAASSAPSFSGDADRVNPEEQLVGALSSCHMLTFLAVAAKKRFTVASYDDDADGHLDKNADGRLAVTAVTLRPLVTFAGDKQPSADDVKGMHEAAHRNCFIANSVKTVVTLEPRFT